ncbi:hypothetical protein HPB52_011515 [Rhipicephalus sanguineus]|uniref:Uncharacterized protein n=1 Tax=Rhipicephalus sanguineus TaxID=34632 RepID=A0A9D4YP54_RHISA|nr:hypothetical protein HPB52_011515 [Rhipicephalus sanguineus]
MCATEANGIEGRIYIVPRTLASARSYTSVSNSRQMHDAATCVREKCTAILETKFGYGHPFAAAAITAAYPDAGAPAQGSTVMTIDSMREIKRANKGRRLRGGIASDIV